MTKKSRLFVFLIRRDGGTRDEVDATRRWALPCHTDTLSPTHQSEIFHTVSNSNLHSIIPHLDFKLNCILRLARAPHSVFSSFSPRLGLLRSYQFISCHQSITNQPINQKNRIDTQPNSLSSFTIARIVFFVSLPAYIQIILIINTLYPPSIIVFCSHLKYCRKKREKGL